MHVNNIISVYLKVSILICLMVFGKITSTTQAQEKNLTAFESWNLHNEMEANSQFAGLFWHHIGPTFMGNRVESIDCPINQPGVIYAGFGSGGLWKTINNGLSWEHVFKQHSYSIGDVAVSISDPSIVWVGTGENLRASRGYSYPGTGVYKSMDAGKNWFNMGLHDSHHISRVVIDPTDANRVFVAALGHFWSPNEQRGLFMTEDGGNTWQHILKISDSVGVSDIAWDPRNKIIYAASWEFLSNPSSGIYRSKDMGKSWELLNNGLPVGPGIGRIGLAVSPSRPERVYAVINNRNILKFMANTPQRGAEIFRSDDYGNSWKRTHTDFLELYSGFGWAFGDIVVSPTNPNEIYVPGVYMIHSLDGGSTFKRIAGRIKHLEPSPAKYLHLDQHDLYIDPMNSDHLILGNDGGIYISHDRGLSWLHTNTIPGGEFYSLNVVQDTPLRIYGGTQDNSSISGEIPQNHVSSNGNNWSYVWLDPWSGGDGFVTIEDPTDPAFVYWESQNGMINRKDINTGESKVIKPVPDADENPLRNSWKTPFFISKHDHRTVYYAANKIYKSINRGEHWYRISHDLTYSKSKFKKSRSLTVLAESPISRGYLFAGTEKGIVWVSRNDGTQWFEISDGIPEKKVVSIYPSNHNSSRVYLVARGMDDDDSNPYVFVSDNLGQKWIPIISNLPPVPINIIIEDPGIENLLYLGSDYGVFVSMDRGKVWKAISSQLPAASVQDMHLDENLQFLMIATHGMGLFRTFIEPIRQFAQSGHPDEFNYLESIPGKLPKEKDYNNDWDLTSGQPAVWTWYNPKSSSTSLLLRDENEIKIWETTVESTAGLNQFIWDLQISHKPDNSIYPIPEIKFPKPGKYILQLISDSTQISVQVQILSK